MQWYCRRSIVRSKSPPGIASPASPTGGCVARKSSWKCAHTLRATATTNALDHDAAIAKVQEWLGHANIATTRTYDRRKMKPEDSPTFKVSY